MNFLNRRINIYKEYLFLLKNFRKKYNTYQLYIFIITKLIQYTCLIDLYTFSMILPIFPDVLYISTCMLLYIEEPVRSIPKFLLLLRTSANFLAKLELQCTCVSRSSVQVLGRSLAGTDGISYSPLSRGATTLFACIRRRRRRRPSTSSAKLAGVVVA